MNALPHRRDFLFGLGATMGTVAFNAMLQAEENKSQPASPLVPKRPHHEPRAKACIFLYMEGGPSHIDTFDPKPKLKQLHMQEFVRQDKFISQMASGKRYFVQSPFKFRQAGESGMWLCEHFRHLADVADDICMYHGLQGESINHPTACYHMNTGNRFGGDPALGAWTTYGLGSENQNLPAFVVMPETYYPQGGAANWSNGFLPAHFQGTPLRSKGAPILDLNPPAGVTRQTQRKNLDLLGILNQTHAKQHPRHDDLTARMEAYELAFRMQTHVPNIIDLAKETKQTRDMYGIGQPMTDNIGRRCLLARRLVESGVRFVQIYVGGWDSHDYIERSHSARMRTVDKPITALIKDLKQRDLLKDTLIISAGEFGRTADNGLRGGAHTAGRDHNNKAMAVWLAGGGVNAGHSIGATDETGQQAVEAVRPIKDLHITLLHLLGLDDNKLTYFHEGRFKQLSQTGGKVITDLVG